MAVGINTHELEKIVIDENEDFASMFEQFEKKESESVSQGEIVAIKDNQVIIAVCGEKKEGVISIDEIKDAKGNPIILYNISTLISLDYNTFYHFILIVFT